MAVIADNWTECKDATTINIVGATVTFDFSDKSLMGVTVQDGANSFRVVKAGYDTIKLLVPKPPEMEDKWELSGTLCDAPYRRLFDYECEAKDLRDELRDHSSTTLTITKVQVPKT